MTVKEMEPVLVFPRIGSLLFMPTRILENQRQEKLTAPACLTSDHLHQVPSVATLKGECLPGRHELTSKIYQGCHACATCE